jgi:hypothetical protein
MNIDHSYSIEQNQLDEPAYEEPYKDVKLMVKSFQLHTTNTLKLKRGKTQTHLM